VQVIRDDEIDFAAYEWQTECKLKVKMPSHYLAEVLEELRPKTADHAPSTFSNKLGRYMRFRPGEVTAWAGYSGHRKSMFTGQLALEFGKQNVSTLVASFEMEPAKTLARMSRQWLATAMPTDAGVSQFMSGTDRKVWLFDHMGRASPSRVLAVCRYFAEELKGRQVIIDSFMMVCGSEEKMDEQKQFATDLVRLAQETGLHVHIIAHCRKPKDDAEMIPPGKHDLRGSAAITDQCSNVITVWMNKPKQIRMTEKTADAEMMEQPDALLTVCKQRNGDFEGKLKFWFCPESLRFVDTRDTKSESWA
jgi:twinkle protein